MQSNTPIATHMDEDHDGDVPPIVSHEEQRSNRSAMAEATAAVSSADSDLSADASPPPPHHEEDDSYKHVKPAAKHFPVSKKEVDDFAERMDHISRVLHDFLTEDPVEAAEKKKQRDAARAAERAQAEKQKLIDRYDPRRYVRFESDELINKLLEEVDKPAQAAQKTAKQRITHLSDFESLTLEQAESKKKDGNAAFAAGDWSKAAELYTLAIELEPVDDELCLALRNNRSQVNINLGRFVVAVEDATVVIQRHPTNVKARMRRARALLELHWPHEALQDIDAALRGEPKNNDALRLAERIRLEKVEVERCSEFEQRSKSAAAQVIASASALKSAKLPSANDDTTLEESAEALTALASALVTCVDVLDERGSETLFRLHGGGEATFRVLKGICNFMESRAAAAAGHAATEGELRPQRLTEDNLLQSLEAQTLTAVLKLLTLFARSHVNLLILGDESLSYCVRTCTDIVLAAQQSSSTATATTPLCARLFAQPRLVPTVSTSKSKSEGKKLSDSATATSSLSTAQEQMRAATAEVQGAATTAALQLLDALTSNGTPSVVRAIADGIPPSAANSLLRPATNGRNPASCDAMMYFALRLFDGLLRHEPTAAETYASVDFAGACLTCVNTKRVIFAEAAVGMMVRLSVSQPQVVQASMTKSSDLVGSLCALLRTGLMKHNEAGPPSKSGTSQHSTLLLEGICSLFFNRTLLLPTLEERQSFLQRLQREKCFSSGFVWLSNNMDTLLSNAQSSRNILNVAARVIGLIGKASVSAPETVTEALVASESPVLWRLYELEALFPSAAQGSPLWDAAEYVDEQKYVQQCIEHASICLAVLYTTSKVSPTTLTRQRLDVLLRLLKLKRQPVTVGNIAMILSVVPKELHGVFGDLQCVQSMINGLVELRTDLFALESEGKRGTTMHQQTQSAQKNVAIALSRVCSTEALLEKMRELRGFEVLYAALDRNPDGSIKDTK